VHSLPTVGEQGSAFGPSEVLILTTYYSILDPCASGAVHEITAEHPCLTTTTGKICSGGVEKVIFKGGDFGPLPHTLRPSTRTV